MLTRWQHRQEQKTELIFTFFKRKIGWESLVRRTFIVHTFGGERGMCAPFNCQYDTVSNSNGRALVKQILIDPDRFSGKTAELNDFQAGSYSGLQTELQSPKLQTAAYSKSSSWRPSVSLQRLAVHVNFWNGTWKIKKWMKSNSSDSGVVASGATTWRGKCSRDEEFLTHLEKSSQPIDWVKPRMICAWRQKCRWILMSIGVQWLDILRQFSPKVYEASSSFLFK